MPSQNKTYVFSKLFFDTLDATAWRIVAAHQDAVGDACYRIYLTVRVDATKGEGVLLRGPDRAYKEDELLFLCGFPSTNKKRKAIGIEAINLLIEEKILEKDENGAIKIVDSDLIFGSETSASRKMKRQREKKASYRGFEKEGGNEGVTKGSDSLPQRYPSVTPKSGFCGKRGNEGVTEGEQTEIPLKNESFKIPLREIETKTGGNDVPPCGGSDFWEKKEEEALAYVARFSDVYPKKAPASQIGQAFSEAVHDETEAEALVIAARRVASDPSKAANGGRYCKDPVSFVLSRPWTEEDLNTARCIREADALERGPGKP